MFRIYYYIFGLDRKVRYVYVEGPFITGHLKLSKEKTSFEFFGWEYGIINGAYFNFDEYIKRDAKNIYERYKCPAYVEVDYQGDSSDTADQIIDNNYKAVVKALHFNHLFRDEYQNWLKNARQ